jgi:hypothetical protein
MSAIRLAQDRGPPDGPPAALFGRNGNPVDSLWPGAELGTGYADLAVLGYAGSVVQTTPSVNHGR